HIPHDLTTDAAHHPNPMARRIRTEHLIRRLRPALGMADAGEARVLFLMGGPDHSLTEGNLLKDQPGAQFKYLATAPIDYPDAINTAQVAKRVAEGWTVLFDDRDVRVRDLLAAAGLSPAPAASADVSPQQLARDYPDHIFLLARSGGPWTGQLPGDLPPAFAA